ncbi:hypothetical protein K2173_022075 [Erythroxylum novogranatense]|uniref:Uncharacterized protein n=1 Tax=Erythroxylum novogranatense TaxID=1862640 RepID=A0AAV8TXQ3_9ROSI|nr:hypothetical protein K2173_022075 [Erythroxylum novogranatense]
MFRKGKKIYSRKSSRRQRYRYNIVILHISVSVPVQTRSLSLSLNSLLETINVIMTSCYRRLSAGLETSNSPIESRRRPVEVLYFPLNRNSATPRPRIMLRCSRHPAWFTVEAVPPSEVVWEPSDGGGNETEKVGPCLYSVRSHQTAAEIQDRRVEVVIAAAITVVLGVGNRVFYKLALVPLKHYPFFLAQLATFGYLLVYFTVLHMRYRAGIVTDEMLAMPKAPFLLVGLLEALAAATGMAAAAILSGASIPILSQTFLVWQLLLSTIFLGRRYKFNQLFGCLLVAVGVVITVASGSSSGHSLKEGGIFWSLLMIFSFLLQAADTVLKEIIFLEAGQQLKGGSVDLFVVNSYGSAFQVGTVCMPSHTFYVKVMGYTV